MFFFLGKKKEGKIFSEKVNKSATFGQNENHSQLNLIG